MSDHTQYCLYRVRDNKLTLLNAGWDTEAFLRPDREYFKLDQPGDVYVLVSPTGTVCHYKRLAVLDFVMEEIVC